MILKRLHFPILFFVLFYSCDRSIDRVAENEGYLTNIREGDSLKDRQLYGKAFYYYEKAKNQTSDSNQKVYALLQMAGLQLLVEDFHGSESTATEAYSIAQDSLYHPYIFNTLAIAYEEQGNYEEALEYYSKCYTNFKREIDKCVVKNNIAVVHLEQGNYKKAIKILKANIKNDSLRSDQMNYAKSLDNLGFALYKHKDARAIDYLKQSEQLRTTLDDDSEKIASYIHLSEYYSDNAADLAKEFAKKAYQSASRINAPDGRIEALKFWIINAEDNEVKELALLQMRITDSITKVRSSAKNQFAKIKYDSDKAIKEQERYKKQRGIATGIGGFAVMLLIFRINFIRKRNKKRLQISVGETENRIAKKVHDEVANDMYRVMAFAGKQDLGDENNKSILLDNLSSIYSKIRDISQSNSEIYTDGRYGNVLLELINSFNSDEVNIIVKNQHNVPWERFSPELKTAVYRVMQELLVNMKKHSQSNLVLLGFEIRAKHLEIQYVDNGIGIDWERFSKKGLRNAENRIKSMKGTFIFDRKAEKGLRLTIQIPK